MSGSRNPRGANETPSGFNDADVGVVHHNTKQLKFTPGSTGFSD